MKSYYYIILSFFAVIIPGITIPLQGQVYAGEDITISAGLPVTLKGSYTGYSGTPVTAQDDYFVGPFEIGFDFQYFDKTHTQFAIGPNGLVSFDIPDILDLVSWGLESIPNNVFNKTIMGPYQDLFDRPIAPHNSYIYYVTAGEEPNRQLIVGWCEAPMYGCNYLNVTYQIVLNENDSTIENHIISKPACYTNLSNKATHGLNLNDLIGVPVPGRNKESWESTFESWLFEPDGPENYIVSQVDFKPEPAAPPGKASYAWYENSYPGGNQISDSREVTVSPIETTTYYFEVALCGGLKYVDEITILTNPIPNAFNPNSTAEENRTFKVFAEPQDNITNFAMYIYNRWGQLIFQTNDITEGWDGTFNGKLCDAGVFVWTIYYEGEDSKSTNQGTVTLVK